MAQTFEQLQDGVTKFRYLYNLIQSNFNTIKSQFSGTTAPVSPVAGQCWFNTTDQNLYQYKVDPLTGAGLWDNTSPTELQEEMELARGTNASLNARLSIGINADGTFKESIPVTANTWVNEENVITYLTSSTFKIAGDVRAVYVSDRAISLTQNISAIMYVDTATLSGEDTIISIKGGRVDTGLSAVAYSTLVKENQPYINVDTLPSQAGNDDKFLKTDGTTASWAEIGGGLPIGSFISMPCTADYIPDGCLPCDGSEYSQSQFPALWTNYLTSSPVKLQTCSYAEYATAISAYGFCDKFAVNTTALTFKVPTRPNKAYIGVNSTAPVKGNGMALGLIGPDTYKAGLTYRGDSGSLTVKSNSYGSNIGIIDATATGNINHYTMGVTKNPTKSGLITDTSNLIKESTDIRWFVVVANTQINQSQMDWSAWATSLAGKANTDLSNITSTGKNNIIDMILPNRAAGVEISGNSYTAPKTGWIYMYVITGGYQWAYGKATVDEIDYSPQNNNSLANTGQGGSIEFFVKKGKTITFTSSGLTTFTKTFFPCEGAS